MRSQVAAADRVLDTVFYQTFPERFASSNIPKPWDDPATPNDFKADDLLGVAGGLDYPHDLIAARDDQVWRALLFEIGDAGGAG